VTSKTTASTENGNEGFTKTASNVMHKLCSKIFYHYEEYMIMPTVIVILPQPLSILP
jgi:hypothetical protein